MAKRIFIEAKPTGGALTSVAHTYLVFREEGVERGNPITDAVSRTIGGHPTSGIASGQMVTAERQFGPAQIGGFDGSRDWYGTGLLNSMPADRTFLDITNIVTSRTGLTADQAWAKMKIFADNLNNHYDYELPTSTYDTTADCNSTTLSVLHSIGIDVRQFLANLNYDNRFNGFPGAEGNALTLNMATLLGSSASDTIEASINLTDGVAVLGRDNRADTLIGTRFADAFFGEQDAAYTATFDTVSYARLEKDFNLKKAGLTVSFSQDELPLLATRPVYVTGVNGSANGVVSLDQADALYGIEKVALTGLNDTVQAGNFKVLQNRLTIDAGLQAQGTGDRIDFAGYQTSTTKVVTEVFSTLGAGREKVSITVNGLSIQKDDVQFANVRLQNFEILNATAKNDHISGARQFKIITTGDGNDYVGDVSGAILPYDTGPAALRQRMEIFLSRGEDILGANIAKGSTVDVGAGDKAIDRINYSAGIRVTGVGNEDYLYVNNRRITGAVAGKDDKGRAFDEARNVVFAINRDGDLRMAA